MACVYMDNELDAVEGMAFASLLHYLEVQNKSAAQLAYLTCIKVKLLFGIDMGPY